MASAHSQQVKDSGYGVFLDQEFVQVSKNEVPLIATSWKKTSLVTSDIEKNANQSIDGASRLVLPLVGGYVTMGWGWVNSPVQKKTGVHQWHPPP